MRSMVTFLLLISATVASALDTPLVLTKQGNGTRMVTIDPSSGAMRLYEIRSGRGDQALRLKETHNFRSDLRRLLNFRIIVDNPLKQGRRDNVDDKAFYSMAQLGRMDRNDPTYSDTLKIFGDPDRQRAILKTEFDFFGSDLAYDGKVQAAYGTTYLVVLIPKSYTMLVYRMDKDTFALSTWHNYRMPLYMTIPDGTKYESAPSFNRLKQAVKNAQGGDVLLAERASEMEMAIEALEEEDKGDLIPMAPSDPWITALQNNRFAMIDPPNNRLLLYQIPSRDTLQLQSVRNIDLDRRLPSFPIPRRLDYIDRLTVEAYLDRLGDYGKELEVTLKFIAEWVKEMRTKGDENGEKAFKFLKPDDTEIAVAFFRTLADSPPPGMDLGASDNREPYDIIFDPGINNNNGERLYFDIKRERRLITYTLQGNNNGIELLSQMDYTIDTGIAMYHYLVEQRIASMQLLERIKDTARRGNRGEWLMQNVNFLLRMSPWMHEELTGNSRITKRLQDEAGWQAAIEKAIQDTETYRTRFTAIVDATKQSLLAKDQALEAASMRRRN